MASLAAIARGEAVHGIAPRISEGLSHPTAPAFTETARTKSASKMKALQVDETDDGALIEP